MPGPATGPTQECRTNKDKKGDRLRWSNMGRWSDMDSCHRQRRAHLFLQDITHGNPLLLLITLDGRVIHIRANPARHQRRISNLL